MNFVEQAHRIEYIYNQDALSCSNDFLYSQSGIMLLIFGYFRKFTINPTDICTIVSNYLQDYAQTSIYFHPKICSDFTRSWSPMILLKPDIETMVENFVSPTNKHTSTDTVMHVSVKKTETTSITNTDNKDKNIKIDIDDNDNFRRRCIRFRLMNHDCGFNESAIKNGGYSFEIGLITVGKSKSIDYNTIFKEIKFRKKCTFDTLTSSTVIVNNDDYHGCNYSYDSFKADTDRITSHSLLFSSKLVETGSGDMYDPYSDSRGTNTYQQRFICELDTKYSQYNKHMIYNSLAFNKTFCFNNTNKNDLNSNTIDIELEYNKKTKEFFAKFVKNDRSIVGTIGKKINQGKFNLDCQNYYHFICINCKVCVCNPNHHSGFQFQITDV